MLQKPLAYKATNLLSINFIDHAFFTRQGGVSKGDFAYLNASYNTNDHKDNVTKNRNIITTYFGNSKHKLVTLNQQRTANVVVVTKNNIPSVNHEGDALITKEPNLILGVVTADCVPILLTDPKEKTIAAIHAGHNGAFLGIIENTINTLVQMGTNPKNIVAALGPSIKQQSYEVKTDFYNKFLKQTKNNENFFYYNNSKNCYFFSLQQYIINKLNNLDVTIIEELHFNTFTAPLLFFSHRYSSKNGKDRGLQASTIVIKENI